MATKIKYYRALGNNLPPALLAKLATMPAKDGDALVAQVTGPSLRRHETGIAGGLYDYPDANRIWIA
jgi:hypothetical protein